MKTRLQIFAVFVAVCFAGTNFATAQCIFKGHEGTTWGISEWYQIIRLDASTLTDAQYPKTGAPDGSDDNYDYRNGVIRNPVGSGEIILPLYDSGTAGEDQSSYSYSIKFHNCVFAPDHYTSAYSKESIHGSTPSGGAWRAEEGTTCVVANDNVEYNTDLYSGQKGFIELSRAPSEEGAESNHGYIQLDGLRNIERIQWSFSSTAWKRGVMVETKKEGATEWTIKRSMPSNQEPYGAYSDQGYTFEETFDMDDDDVFSFRIRIWDGDQTTWRWAYDLGERPDGYFYTEVAPHGAWQVVRVHRLNVYASITGTQLATGTNGIEDNYADSFSMLNLNGTLKLSEEGNVEIYTIDGKLVKTDAGTDINVTDLNSGVYVVKVTSLSGVTKNVKVAL